MDDLIAAWLTARSIARNLPPPVPDRGGYRVDTNAEKEVCRWVFPRVAEGLRALGREIVAPFHALKLCADRWELRDALPERWTIDPLKYVMVAGSSPCRVARPVDGYRLERHASGAVTHVLARGGDGSLAASGYAVEAAGVFIYDRIVTAPGHRRLGLGGAVMAALGQARQSAASREVLVATGEGRGLYLSLGWVVRSPFATATIPEAARACGQR